MRRLGVLLGTVAVGLLALAPASRAANEVEVHDDPSWGATRFFVPNGFLGWGSRCPSTSGFEGEVVKTVCPFTLVVEHWSALREELVPVFTHASEPGRMSNDVTMKWPSICEPGGPYFWKVEIFTEDRSYYWVERGRDDPVEPGFCRAKPEPSRYQPSRLEAQRAVVDYLYPMFVSRLQCSPHDDLRQLCQVTFNNTYAQCRGAYWVEGFNRPDPSKADGVEAWPAWKRCRPL